MITTRLRQFSIALVLFAHLPGLVGSQAAKGTAAHPQFEVATLKPSLPPTSDSININLGVALHDKITLTNATLADCIKFAYGIVADAQLSGPDWVMHGPNRFDIVAKAPPGTPNEQLLGMLRSLLADRLHLVTHKERKDLRFLALSQDKTGTRLRSSASDAVPASGPMLFGSIVNAKMSIPTLAKLLSRFERQTILDQTGLEGTFDIHLKWTPGTDKSDAPVGDGPSLYTALREQLGLRLEARKGPVEVIVVDSAEKVPAEN